MIEVSGEVYEDLFRIHTDKLIDRVDDFWDGLHLEERMLGHTENEEVPLVRVKLGNRLLLRIVALYELRKTA